MNKLITHRRKVYSDKTKQLKEQLETGEYSEKNLQQQHDQLPSGHADRTYLRKMIKRQTRINKTVRKQLTTHLDKPFPMPKPGNHFANTHSVAVPVSIALNRPVVVNTIQRGTNATRLKRVERLKEVQPKCEHTQWEYFHRRFAQFDSDDNFLAPQRTHLLRQIGYLAGWVDNLMWGRNFNHHPFKHRESVADYLARTRKHTIEDGGHSAKSDVVNYMRNYNWFRNNQVKGKLAYRTVNSKALTTAAKIMSPKERFDYYNFDTMFNLPSLFVTCAVDPAKVKPHKIRLEHLDASSPENYHVLFAYCVIKRGYEYCKEMHKNTVYLQQKDFELIADALDQHKPGLDSALERVFNMKNRIAPMDTFVSFSPSGFETLKVAITPWHVAPLFCERVRTKRLQPTPEATKMLKACYKDYKALLKRHGLKDTYSVVKRQLKETLE